MKSYQESSKRYFLFVFIALTLLLISMVYVVGQEYTHTFSTRNYVEAKGEVLSSQVEVRRGSKGAKKYLPNIKYNYIYEDEKFINNQYRPMKNSIGMSRTRAVLSEHPVGQKITVFVNPDNPAQSYLVKGLLPEYVLSNLLLLSICFTWLILLYMQVSGNMYFLKSENKRKANMIYKEPSPMGFGLLCLTIGSYIIGFTVLFKNNYPAGSWTTVVGMFILYIIIFTAGYIFRSVYTEPFNLVEDWIDNSKILENKEYEIPEKSSLYNWFFAGILLLVALTLIFGKY